MIIWVVRTCYFESDDEEMMIIDKTLLQPSEKVKDFYNSEEKDFSPTLVSFH